MEFSGPNRRRLSALRETSQVARSESDGCIHRPLYFIDILRYIYSCVSCSRKLGGTVILYNELKLFVSLNCFNVDHLLFNFTQSRLAVSLSDKT